MQIHLKPGESIQIRAGNEVMIVHAYYGLNPEFLDMQPDPEPYEILPWMKDENICLKVRHEIPKTHYVKHENPSFMHNMADFHGLRSMVKEEGKD